ncbi:MAG: hypothetical protein ISQ14_12510 [Verrucomicrobiae bacterium]|nr:hypothetical protein [Verrucomicrobiae bacterium]
MQPRLGLFAKRPTVTHEDGRIVIRNSIMTRVLNFSTHLRRVELDPVTRTLRYTSRFFWFFVNRAEVPFDEISHLALLSGSMETGYSRVSDEIESDEGGDEFSVAFVTRSDDLLEIATYDGELGRIKGRTLDQDSPVAELVSQLVNLLGIRLETGGPKRKRLFTRCPGCRRKISRFASKCIYCKQTGR